ncbi:hypothetical protein I4F81_002098 [Pyropia yezoensis]|uniref:Uncharacterized protein n=1 Tax=Pyropia yezoensis TaxID=2788 RepID=A0ACC3BPH7_PYRYE|nr:hypothetical protein I4F81_002098 [Neopyropia yezoensis]
MHPQLCPCRSASSQQPQHTLAPSDARPATYQLPRTPRSLCRCHKKTQRRRHRQPTQRRPPPSPAVPPPPQLYPGATAAAAAAAPVMPACSPASKKESVRRAHQHQSKKKGRGKISKGNGDSRKLGVLGR